MESLDEPPDVRHVLDHRQGDNRVVRPVEREGLKISLPEPDARSFGVRRQVDAGQLEIGPHAAQVAKEVAAAAADVEHRRPGRQCGRDGLEERDVRMREPALMRLVEVVGGVAFGFDRRRVAETMCARRASVEVGFRMLRHEVGRGAAHPAGHTNWTRLTLIPALWW